MKLEELGITAMKGILCPWLCTLRVGSQELARTAGKVQGGGLCVVKELSPT